MLSLARVGKLVDLKLKFADVKTTERYRNITLDRFSARLL